MKKIYSFLAVSMFLTANQFIQAQGETCATALTITEGTYTSDGPTTGGGASTYSGDTHSDWYKFVAPSNGTLIISSCGSGIDTRLFAFTGTCASLTNVISTDDDCGSNEEAVFEMTQNQELYIEWSDRYDNGPVTFSIQFAEVIDGGTTCSNAIVVSEGIYSATGPSSGGGSSAISGGTNSSWYAFVPSETNVYNISSCRTIVGTDLSIHRGACASLINVENPSSNCDVSVELEAGVIYYIEWSDQWSSSDFMFEISKLNPGEFCQNAFDVGVGTHTVENILSGYGASAYSGDDHAKWYTFTPSSSGFYTVSSCDNTGIDTRLFMFTGTCASLTNIASNDDDCGSNETETYNMTGGVTYFIEWTDRYDASGFDFVIASGLTSTEDVLENQFKVIPNPSSGRFVVDLGAFAGKNAQCSVINSTGQVVTESFGETDQIDISDQPNGLYYVIVNVDGQTTTVKLIKE